MTLVRAVPAATMAGLAEIDITEGTDLSTLLANGTYYLLHSATTAVVVAALTLVSGAPNSITMTAYAATVETPSAAVTVASASPAAITLTQYAATVAVGAAPVTVTSASPAAITLTKYAATVEVTGGTTTDLVMTIETTGSDEVFTFQVYNSGASWNTTGVYIDWDGGTTITNPTTYGHAGLSHTYPTAGTHEIRIYRNGTGSIPNFYFANSSTMAQKIRTVSNLGDVGFVSLSGGFQGCSGMTSFVAGNCDTSSITYLSNTFHTCSAMTTCDLDGFTTPAVTYMDGMFEGCSALTSVDVTGFDTADVITFTRMFRYCSSLSGVDPSGWDIGSVTGLGFSNFIEDWALSTAVYDALLIAWEAQTPPSGVTANFGSGTTYTSGGAAATAWNSLDTTYGWDIYDGGTA